MGPFGTADVACEAELVRGLVIVWKLVIIVAAYLFSVGPCT
jgi:hypothetical protein